MPDDNPSNRKALGVGLFYVLGGLLAIVGWPPIIPSVLLGSGIALMVYHFLGGVDSNDRVNWSLGNKAAVQVGGASASLIFFSAGINHFLMQWQEDQAITSKPALEDVIVLGKDGKPVPSLEFKRGKELLPILQWPKQDSPRSLRQQPLELDLDSKNHHIIVRSKSDQARSLFAYGFLDGDFSSGPPPLADIVQEMIVRDFFNPTLVQIRSQICAGAKCPVSVIGFPIVLMASKGIEEGSLQICYHKRDFAVAETFAPASSKMNPSLVIQALAIAPGPDSPTDQYRNFRIAIISPVEATPACLKANSQNAVIALISLKDLKSLTGHQGLGPITLFATNSSGQ